MAAEVYEGTIDRHLRAEEEVILPEAGARTKGEAPTRRRGFDEPAARTDEEVATASDLTDRRPAERFLAFARAVRARRSLG